MVPIRHFKASPIAIAKMTQSQTDGVTVITDRQLLLKGDAMADL